MTEEQIAELKRQAADEYGPDLTGLERLLEERKRLLDALRVFNEIRPLKSVYDCEADSGEYDSFEMVKAKSELLAAIAFADEPA